MINFEAKTSDRALLNGIARIDHFSHTKGLAHCTEICSNDLLKLQGVISKISISKKFHLKGFRSRKYF